MMCDWLSASGNGHQEELEAARGPCVTRISDEEATIEWPHYDCPLFGLEDCLFKLMINTPSPATNLISIPV